MIEKCSKQEPLRDFQSILSKESFESFSADSSRCDTVLRVRHFLKEMSWPYSRSLDITLVYLMPSVSVTFKQFLN